jgi:hypothetical protein
MNSLRITTSWITAVVLAICFVSTNVMAKTSPKETQAIAQEAFVYAYPMLFNYKTLYQYTQDYQTAGYAGGFGRFRNYARDYTPADTTIVTVNNDTPYSWAWVDLRAEPWVLSVPAVPKDRYYTMQLVDLYSYNFAYVGLRATGNEAGDYLIAGPDWKGGTPDGIAKVLKAETQFVIIGGRTQLKDSKDMPNVVAIQRQYHLRPLSEFLAATPPPPSPQLPFPTWDEKRATGPDFISYLNFMLQFAPTVPSEKKMMARFAKIGIGPGKPFDAASLDPKLRAAIEAGIKAANEQIKKRKAKVTSSVGLFGTPKQMRKYSDGYLRRAVAAVMGIYGNSPAEAYYTPYLKDKAGKPLSAKNRYVMHLNPPPPTKYFWSLTMYNLPQQLLVANPLNRYKLSNASEGLVKNSDGSITLYLQHDAPKDAKQKANWLPAPAEGNFYMILRMYGPEKPIIDGKWKSPPVELAK